MVAARLVYKYNYKLRIQRTRKREIPQNIGNQWSYRRTLLKKMSHFLFLESFPQWARTLHALFYIEK